MSFNPAVLQTNEEEKMCAMKGLNRRQFITSSTALTGAAMLPWSFSAHAAAVTSATPGGTP
ncbi:twin-arginine translocation signal domain-containing protein (plasmid) [Pseudomonas silvicola]|nr:twin-arginine translocation signal domain-containing protein [Pseudomonas silvicola]